MQEQIEVEAVDTDLNIITQGRGILVCEYI